VIFADPVAGKQWSQSGVDLELSPSILSAVTQIGKATNPAATFTRSCADKPRLTTVASGPSNMAKMASIAKNSRKKRWVEGKIMINYLEINFSKVEMTGSRNSLKSRKSGPKAAF
jgi:hypothetical protein